MGGGGEREGNVAGGYEHESHHIFYTRHIVTISSSELYRLVRIFQMVFIIESIDTKLYLKPSKEITQKV